MVYTSRVLSWFVASFIIALAVQATALDGAHDHPDGVGDSECAMGVPTASLIFLHGLGDTHRGWRGHFRSLLKALKFDHVRLVTPDAPTAAVTVNFGATMPSWFDIMTLGWSEAEIRDENLETKRYSTSNNHLMDEVS